MLTQYNCREGATECSFPTRCSCPVTLRCLSMQCVILWIRELLGLIRTALGHYLNVHWDLLSVSYDKAVSYSSIDIV